MPRPSPHPLTAARLQPAMLALVGGCVLANPEFDRDSASASESGGASLSGAATTIASTSASTSTSTGASAGTGGEASTAASASGGASESEGASASASTGAPLTCADLTCVDNASCEDTVEGPTCACDPGFEPADELCVDIDECEGDLCPDGLCVNNPGGYTCAYPATCAELLALFPDTADGPATLYVGGAPEKPWAAYCHDMAGKPREYLTLPRQGGNTNIGRYTIINELEDFMGDRRLRFQRVRLNPANLRVDIGDVTFTSGEGAATFDDANVVHVAYGTAMTCVAGTTSVTIDLRDTHFDVQGGTFCTDGYIPFGQTSSPESRVYVNTGGGDCGWRAPGADKCPYTPINNGATGAGERLQLVYVGL